MITRQEDRKRKRILLHDDEEDTTVAFPAIYEVCYACQGSGTTVAPGIDSHGLSAEDFAEDPDFADDYWAGRYDIQCQTCFGQNVLMHIDDSREFTEEQKAILRLEHAELEAHLELEEAQEAERRMGA